LSVPLFFFAYSKHAEVTVPSLDDWEKQWKKNPQGIVKPAVVQVDFTVRRLMRSPLTTKFWLPKWLACDGRSF